MKNTLLLSALAMSALTAPGLMAQTHPTATDSRPEHLMFDGDTISVGKIMQENAPSHYNIPGLPRFAIFGKEGKFYLGIGGTIKGTAGYDFGSTLSNPNVFSPSNIPIHPQAGTGGRFMVSAQQSNLFLNFVALPGSDNQIGAFVSVNFLNDNYRLNLQQAYLHYRGIKAGYAYGIFCDMAAGVPTIDYQGPNSFIAAANGVVDYEHSFGRRHEWKFGVGVEMPITSATQAEKTAKVTQRLPDIPAYIQYSWSEGSGWLRLAGIIRNLYYRDVMSGKNIDKVGWGFNLSGSTPIAGGLRAYYQAAFGKGITSYFQDLTGDGMDLMPVAGRPSTLNTVKAWGGYVGLQYTFSPKVYCSATYSHLRTYAPSYDDAATAAGEWSGQYKYAQYAVANVFWDITPIIRTGLEYLYGRRVDYSGAQAHDNRIQTMIQLSF